MPKRRDPNKPPRKFSRPLIKPFIQRLSDYSTVQPEAKDDLQASTVFTDDIAGGDGELHEMKPEAMQPTKAVQPAREFVPVVPIKPMSKHEEKLKATVARLKSLEIAMQLMQTPEAIAAPAHNQVYISDDRVITVHSPSPKSWRRL